MRTGWLSVARRIRLLKYQSQRLPTRTAFLSLKGIWPATSCSFCSRPLKDHLAVKLQSPHVVTLFRMDMVQYLGVGKIAVKGEIAGNVPCQGIVNQVEAQAWCDP